jgi:hypothetical protein
MDRQFELAKLLVSRLERLSADSYWAHQASGLRGSLLRAIDRAEGRIEQGSGTRGADLLSEFERKQLGNLIERGFAILEKDARLAAASLPSPAFIGRSDIE